jgi:hypothetical protein
VGVLIAPSRRRVLASVMEAQPDGAAEARDRVDRRLRARILLQFADDGCTLARSSSIAWLDAFVTIGERGLDRGSLAC